MKFGVKNEWMTYYEWDIKYPTTSTSKELEVLSVANHRKILNYIQSHFSFMGLGDLYQPWYRTAHRRNLRIEVERHQCNGRHNNSKSHHRAHLYH